MSSHLFVFSKFVKDELALLNSEHDGAHVMAGVGIGSSDDSAIVGTESYHVVTVAGTVMGHESGIYLGNKSTADHDQYLKVEAGGRVFGNFYNGAAAVGYNSRIANEGMIYGDATGIYLDGNSPGASATMSEVINSGAIEGRMYGVFHDGTETLNIVNTGSIKAGVSFSGRGEASERITNAGTMTGAVELGDGNDLYDGRKGKVVGAVFGEAGNDRIYGGKEANTIFSGNGNDELSGGAGRDSFVFDFALNKSTNVDRIGDFSHADDTIRLDDDIFGGIGLVPADDSNGLVKLGKDAFWASSSGLAHDASDRVLYDTTDGRLYYDADGKGGAEGVVFARLTANLKLDASDFLLVT